MIRGAFLAPWFAVSLGIVIAASLTLAAPHAALTFPTTKSGQCDSVNCPATRHDSSKDGPRSRAGTDGKRAARLHPSTPRQRGRRVAGRISGQAGQVAVGVRVRYGLLHEQAGHFMAMIVIEGQRSLGAWTLEFELRRSRINAIMWAKWAFEKTGSVVVDGIPSPWPRSSPDQARIVIFGTGKPQWPGDCVFSGARCAFIPLSHGPDAGWAGSG